MVNKVIKEPLKGRDDIFRLLLLLFYNNNTYDINYASIQLIANELNFEKNLIEHLQQLIFITSKDEQEKLEKTVKYYK